MKNKFLLAAGVMLAPFSAANAATTLSASPATNPYSGPAPIYDFSTPAPIVGGSYRSGTVTGVASQPFGTNNPYYAVGPAVTTPAFLSLANFAKLGFVSLSWGSVDVGNLLQVINRAGAVLATVTGTQVQGLVGTAGAYYPKGALVTLNFSGATRTDIGGLRFSSRNNSFEFDNIAVGPVPEPATWALMLVGFAATGFAMRRRPRTTARVRFA